MRRVFLTTLSFILIVTSISTSYAIEQNPQWLVNAAKKEGEVNSVGMPDSWANWIQTWKDLKTKYNINHIDTDMSSDQELITFESQKRNATADIGDVGLDFAKLAKKKKIILAYKPTTWDQIPEWAKDKDGYWCLSYTGTIAFIINKKLVKNPPKSFHDLLKGKYRISIGDVGQGNSSNMAVLAAAYAMGGDETNIKPALKLFANIASQGRLAPNSVSLASLESGEVEVGIEWDFNALNYRDKINKNIFEVVIPSDGSVTSGYSTVINKYSKHPNAAKLAREYILSDQGQINLANGFARPIRADHIKLPSNVREKLLPSSEYRAVHTIKDYEKWGEIQKKLASLWQEKVLINIS